MESLIEEDKILNFRMVDVDRASMLRGNVGMTSTAIRTTRMHRTIHSWSVNPVCSQRNSSELHKSLRLPISLIWLDSCSKSAEQKEPKCRRPAGSILIIVNHAELPRLCLRRIGPPALPASCSCLIFMWHVGQNGLQHYASQPSEPNE